MYITETKGKMHLVVNKATGSVHGAFKEKELADEKAKAMTRRDKNWMVGRSEEN